MSSQPIKFHSYLSALIPYQSAGNHFACQDQGIRLCYNEGAFGPNPKVVEACTNAIGQIHIYPEMVYAQLRQALAEKFNLDASRIVCGAGSDELISLLVHAFAREGDEVVSSQYGFAMYPVAAKTVGAKPVLAPEKDNLRTDLAAMRTAITEKTRLVFIANPNNPTGSWLTRDELNDFIRDLPPHVLLVYDAAYADYMDEADYSNGLEWVKEDGNVCVIRTFSKIHGLAGMRVGWSYVPRMVAEALNRIRNPFNISVLSEIAAITSLQDDAFIDMCKAHTIVWRDKLMGVLADLKIRAYPSKCNFVLARFSSPAQADKLFHFLKDRKITLRPMAGYGLPDCLRITIGRENEMNALFAALKEFGDFKHAA